MKRFFGFVTCIVCVLSSSLFANAPPTPSPSSNVAELVLEGEPTPPNPEPEDPSSKDVQLAEGETSSDSEETPKFVGKASQESIDAAKDRAWVKYVAAAGAIVIAVVALLLVSKDPGKRPKN